MSLNKGIFNLSNFLNLGDDDILETNINESGEFAANSNAMNNMDTGSSTNINIPGGYRESPTAKPYDASSISVPNGDGERPKARPYDETNISIPSGKTLSADTYNVAISSLKKSFKEAYEIMEMMENATILNKTTEQLQDEYTESAIGDAILLSYENGPIFEAVKRSDKHEVKEIVSEIRKDLKDNLYDMRIKFYKPNLIARILTSFIPTVGVVNAAASISQFWSNRLWQILGVVLIEEGNINKLTDNLTRQYESDLGDYKILYQETDPSIADLFRVKFNWKNNLKSYFLLVDRKLPIELDEMQTAVSNSLKASEDGKPGSKEESKKKDKKEDKKDKEKEKDKDKK